MNEAVKKQAEIHSPEDYGPKKPEIIRMAKEMRKTELARLPETMILENILSPYEPWVGGCGYLLCLTALYMYAERGRQDFYEDRSMLADFNDNLGFGEEDSPMTALNRERIYKVLLTATGMGVFNHFRPTGTQYSDYEAAPGYLDRSMRFCGYAYEELTAEGAENLTDRVRISIGAEIPVLAEYADGWALIVGYDCKRAIYILRKGEANEEREIGCAELKRMVIVTDIGGTPSDWKELLREVVEGMETDAPELGMQGYRSLIHALRDDAFFADMTAEESLKWGNTVVWSWFIQHSEARGFSGQGFEWRFLNRHEDANRLADLWCRLSYYGDQHHQIGWCGYNIFTAAGNDIRPKQVRERMIEAVYHMMDNDRLICRTLKELIGLDTPDVLLAKDPDSGEIFDTQIRVREDASYNEMMAGIRIRRTQEIDLAGDLAPIGGVEPVMEEGRLVFTGNNGIDDMAGMQLKTPVTVPFLVRMRMKTTRNNVHIYFGDGCITFRKHPHTYDSLYIRDNAIGLYYGYDQKGEVEPDTFFTLEWLVGKDRFAVAVDGEVRHCGENYPYMHMPSLWKDFLRFGTADGNTLTVEHMTVMEVE